MSSRDGNETASVRRGNCDERETLRLEFKAAAEKYSFGEKAMLQWERNKCETP